MTRASEVSRVFLSLGSNLGDRLGMLHAAVDKINTHTLICVNRTTGVSSVYETSPVECAYGQPAFLNTVIEVETKLSAVELMAELLAIETQLGRTRSSLNAARLIDIDLLLFGSQTCEDVNLRLPHPRMHERRFVLEPLCEIAGDVIHPVLGKTIVELTDMVRNKYTDDVLVRIDGPKALLSVS